MEVGYQPPLGSGNSDTMVEVGVSSPLSIVGPSSLLARKFPWS